MAHAAAAHSGPAGWILRDVDRALADGMRLYRWWENKEAHRSFRTSFRFLKDVTPPDRCFGFFDEAEISSGPIGVMGLVQEMGFDRPKAGTAEQARDQVREFVLRYFLRVTNVRPPQPDSQLGIGSLTGPLLGLLRLGPPRTDIEEGFRYTQLYYKEAGTGRIAAFPASEGRNIMDLRDLGAKLEWIILSARPFDYELDIAPIGPAGPRLVLPLPDTPVLAINPQMVIDQEYPAPGVLGRYGFTYALLDDPDIRGPQVYGPAQYKACFQTIQFEALDTGESRVRLAFTGNIPDKILDVKIDPIGLALKTSDFFSFGLTSRLLEPAQGLLAKRPVLGSFDPLLGFISMANIAT